MGVEGVGQDGGSSRWVSLGTETGRRDSPSHYVIGVGRNVNFTRLYMSSGPVDEGGL